MTPFAKLVCVIGCAVIYAPLAYRYGLGGVSLLVAACAAAVWIGWRGRRRIDPWDSRNLQRSAEQLAELHIQRRVEAEIQRDGE